MYNDPDLQQPMMVEIQVSGHLSQGRAEWLGSMAVSVKRLPGGGQVTVLKGTLADQAALFGTLSRIRDLGLKLISVNPVERHADAAKLRANGQEEGR